MCRAIDTGVTIELPGRNEAQLDRLFDVRELNQDHRREGVVDELRQEPQRGGHSRVLDVLDSRKIRARPRHQSKGEEKKKHNVPPHYTQYDPPLCTKTSILLPCRNSLFLLPSIVGIFLVLFRNLLGRDDEKTSHCMFFHFGGGSISIHRQLSLRPALVVSSSDDHHRLRCDCYDRFCPFLVYFCLSLFFCPFLVYFRFSVFFFRKSSRERNSKPSHALRLEFNSVHGQLSLRHALVFFCSFPDALRW